MIFMNDNDKKWMDALRPYWGGGVVPNWKLSNGEVDASRTIDWMMKVRGQKKIGPNGEDLEWPSSTP